MECGTLYFFYLFGVLVVGLLEQKNTNLTTFQTSILTNMSTLCFWANGSLLAKSMDSMHLAHLIKLGHTMLVYRECILL